MNETAQYITVANTSGATADRVPIVFRSLQELQHLKCTLN